MNEHRPTQNPGIEGNNLARAAKELTSDGQPQHSWLDDARKSAYSTAGWIKDTAEHAPVGTAITALGIGVAAYGALRTGLAARVLAGVEGEALYGGTEATSLGGKTIVHLTTAEGEIGIANTLKIGSRWGVFGLESGQVPEHALARNVTSLVTKDLTSEVAIGPRASSYFKAPTPVGPFSLARNLAGVRSTPLGSIDLARDTFIPNEIFSNGVFRQATGGEVAKYKIHQWLLDYGVDSLSYTLAGISTAALEYKQICNKSARTEEKWHRVTARDLPK
jgi:hypothetical protein